MEIHYSCYRLKSDQVALLMREQELKVWWVAEMAGVHKTTLHRWLSGKICRVKGDHIERLALVLAAKASDIAEPVRPSYMG